MKTINQLKDLGLEDLKNTLNASREEQFKLRFKKSRGDLKQTHLLRQVKVKIAQVKTLMTQKEEVSND
jgi:large subunit ribosomal protein L29